MEREDLLKSKEYWITKIQLQLYELVEDYLETNDMNRTTFAGQLGVTKGYVSQVLNGDYDHRISKFVDLSLKIGKVPFVQFRDINEIIELDRHLPYGDLNSNNITYYGVGDFIGMPTISTYRPPLNFQFDFNRLKEEVEEATIYDENIQPFQTAA